MRGFSLLGEFIIGGSAMCLQYMLDTRLRTTSDPFNQHSRPHQRNMVAPGYGKRAESTEDVMGVGRGWGRGEEGEEEEEEERPPEEPERRYSPA